MVFPTVSYSTRLLTRPRASPIPRIKVGPRLAWNIYDRIAAYDRGFQRYMHMDSKLAAWTKRVHAKPGPSPPPSIASLSRRSSASSGASSTLSSKLLARASSSLLSPPPSPGMHASMQLPSPPMPKPSMSKRIVGALTSRYRSTVPPRSPLPARLHRRR
ncbi:hypothetical protein BC940DRAFT_335693 [Gongronella butleri]|nr:hypothetical protein BC940DRAFT_335693 [Gongronella butleri]